MNEKENKNKMPRFNMNWIYGIIIVILVYLFFTGTGGSSSKTWTTRLSRHTSKRVTPPESSPKKTRACCKWESKKSTVLTCSAQTMSKASEACPSSAVEYADNKALLDLVHEAQNTGAFKGALKYEQSNDFMSNIFWNFFPLLFIIAIWIFIMRRMGGGSPTGSSVFSVGKSKAKLIEKGEATRVTSRTWPDRPVPKMEVAEIVEVPQEPEEVHRPGRQDSQRSLAGRSSGNR